MNWHLLWSESIDNWPLFGPSGATLAATQLRSLSPPLRFETGVVCLLWTALLAFALISDSLR